MLIKYTTGDEKKYKEIKKNWDSVYKNKSNFEEPTFIEHTKNPPNFHKEEKQEKRTYTQNVYEENTLKDNKEWIVEYENQEIILRHIKKYKLYQLIIEGKLIAYAEEQEKVITGRIKTKEKNEIIKVEIKGDEDITIEIGKTIIFKTT